jgi:TPR repeat protein
MALFYHQLGKSACLRPPVIQRLGQGRADAQSTLGVIYAEGDDVAQDFVQAFKWFSFAAAQNHKDAIENRNQAVTLMSPAQLVEGEQLAREWRRTISPQE